MANLGNTIVNGILRVNGKINSSDVISAPSFVGALTGNAATATKLATARTINGVSFDGSANITVADSTKLPLTGGTLSGAVNFANGTLNKIGDDVSIGDVNQAGKLGIKGLNGATGIYFQPHSGSTAQSLSIDGAGAMTISGKIKSTFEGNLTGTATKATQDADGNVISSTYLKLSGGTMTGTIKGVDSVGGKTFFDIGSVDTNTTILRIHDRVDDTANAKGAFGYTLKYLGSGSGVENRLVLYADNLEAANQVAAISMTNNGKITFGEEVTAATFKGSLNGNAATATKLQTARTIGVSGVTGTAQSFNGTANIVIPITAVPSTLLTNKSAIKGSEITNDKHWIPSSDASVTNFVSMTAEEYAANASSLATGTIVAITDGVEGYVTTQATSLTCDLPLDL